MFRLVPVLAALILFVAPACAQPMAPARADTAGHGTGDTVFDAMIDVLFGGARRVLDERGAFYPTSLAFDRAGDLVIVNPYVEGMTLDTLVEKAREILANGIGEGTFTATARLFDVYAIPPGESARTDAMMIQLENPDAAILYFLPYRRTETGIVYGTPWLADGRRELFSKEE